jgi:two-component system, OmpR family, phosphate regulon response regulator PhoB
MPGTPTPALSVVGNDDRPSTLVIDVPAGTSPALWHLAERVGATLEELFAAAASTPGDPTQHERSVICLDLQARSAWRDHHEVHLTHLEFELLAYFARNPSRAISRGELLDNVWNEPAHFGGRTIDVHIRRLRRKLGPELHLTTVRGFGYRLDGWNAAATSGSR